MTLFMSVAVVVAGLLLALVLDASQDARMFGWVLAGAGVVGVASRVVLSRSRGRGGRRDPSR